MIDAMPRFKLDENLPVEAAELFRSAGYDAMTVLDQGLGGHTDELIAMRCHDEQRTIVTFDMDFSDIRSYPPEDHSGILVLRLKSQDKRHVLAVLKLLIPHFERETLTRKLWIVTEQTVRIRG